MSSDQVPLTEREITVMRLVADGHTHAEISRQLFLSYRTVKNVVMSAYAKLGVPNGPAAVAALIRSGVLK